MPSTMTKAQVATTGTTVEASRTRTKPKKEPVDPSAIRNKMKRMEVMAKVKQRKKTDQKIAREKRKKAVAAGEMQPMITRTLENTREEDVTTLVQEDTEALQNIQVDELADYYLQGKTPKLLITTSIQPKQIGIYKFIEELLQIFPNSYFYRRRKYELTKIIEYAKNRDFTNIVVIHQDKKVVNGLMVIHLPEGPTAYFKLSSLVLRKDIKDHGKPNAHGAAEVILNNFTTRLGHSVGRLLGTMFTQTPDFYTRTVATFHNQRDFIFFRHHRYIFDSAQKARIQELGPRFTLKLRWLQRGPFDPLHGNFEWIHKSYLDTSRRRFHL